MGKVGIRRRFCGWIQEGVPRVSRAAFRKSNRPISAKPLIATFHRVAGFTFGGVCRDRKDRSFSATTAHQRAAPRRASSLPASTSNGNTPTLLARRRLLDSRNQLGRWHVKFEASSILPEPLYRATSGHAQRGRDRTVFPPTMRAAGIAAGVWPSSTHRTRAVAVSKVPVPMPPPQWNIPGTMNRRAKSGVDAPIFAITLS